MPTVEQQREATLRALAEHYAAGHVRTGTLEHRVEQTIDARTIDALRDAVWDLPPLGHRLRRALAARFAPASARRIAFRTAAAMLDLDLESGPRTYLVGRSRSCDVVLADPAVSRRHALISIRGGRCSVRNLASMNGTHVNGRPITTAVLHAGDVVTFGRAVDALVR